MVFFHLVTKGWIFNISLYENSINQSINQCRRPDTRFSLRMEMSRLTRDGTAEPVSLDQILRHVRGQGNIHFPCSADHEQDCQLYPVDLYSAIYGHTYIHTQTFSFSFFPCSADHERDWPPCKVVFFGLATNALNVRNNKQQHSQTCFFFPFFNLEMSFFPSIFVPFPLSL